MREIEAHLGLGLIPASTSSHTCNIICLASISLESMVVAICSILPLWIVLLWGFFCPDKYTVMALQIDSSSHPPAVYPS